MYYKLATMCVACRHARHKNYMGLAGWCTGSRRKTLEKQQKFSLFIYGLNISQNCHIRVKTVPLTYGRFTFRTPKSPQVISQHVKWFPLMQSESKSQQFCCGRGLFLLAQAVNDCLKHKALERQAGNDNELSDQPNILNAMMIQLHWISIFW